MQKPLVMSSAEGEYNSLVTGAQECRAIQTLLEELGVKTKIELRTDSSAAKGSCERVGLLHLKHMELRQLFLKDLVKSGLIEIVKIPTTLNVADMLTKPVTMEVLARCLAQAPSWTHGAEVNMITLDRKTNQEWLQWREDRVQWLGVELRRLEDDIWRIDGDARRLRGEHRGLEEQKKAVSAKLGRVMYNLEKTEQKLVDVMRNLEELERQRNSLKKQLRVHIRQRERLLRPLWADVAEADELSQ